MLSRKKKNFVIIIVPIICFFAMAAVLVGHSDFDYLGQSDFLGFVEDKPFKMDVRLAIKFSEKPANMFAGEAVLSLVIPGPVESSLWVLLSPQSQVVAKEDSTEKEFHGLHSFVIPLSIGVHGRKMLTFRYLLPPRASGYIVKLLPAGNSTYGVTAEFPDYVHLTSNMWKINGSEAIWRGTPMKPLTLYFSVKKIRQPLKITDVKIVGLNKIILQAEHSLSAKIKYDDSNFAVTDLNTANPEVTDRMLVKNVETQGKTITLTLEGMTFQRGESYRIMAKNIQDAAGNFIAPNPFKITFRQ